MGTKGDWLVQGNALKCFTYKFPIPMPMNVWENKQTKWWISPLPSTIKYYGAWVFFGLYPNERAEMAIEIYNFDTGKGGDRFPLVLRSFHRHNGEDFESWTWHPPVHNNVRFDTVRVLVSGQSMDKNPISPHFGLRILGWEV